MYNSWTLEFFTHTLAQATGCSEYIVHNVSEETGTDQHDALMREMYNTVAGYNRWADDGFIQYIKFRFTDNNTKEERFYQYDFDQNARVFRLNQEELLIAVEQNSYNEMCGCGQQRCRECNRFK